MKDFWKTTHFKTDFPHANAGLLQVCYCSQSLQILNRVGIGAPEPCVSRVSSSRRSNFRKNTLGIDCSFVTNRKFHELLPCMFRSQNTHSWCFATVKYRWLHNVFARTIVDTRFWFLFVILGVFIFRVVLYLKADFVWTLSFDTYGFACCSFDLILQCVCSTQVFGISFSSFRHGMFGITGLWISSRIVRWAFDCCIFLFRIFLNVTGTARSGPKSICLTGTRLVPMPQGCLISQSQVKDVSALILILKTVSA